MNIRCFEVRFDALSLDFVIYHEINISQMHLPDADVRRLCRGAWTLARRVKIVDDKLVIEVVLSNITSEIAMGVL